MRCRRDENIQWRDVISTDETIIGITDIIYDLDTIVLANIMCTNHKVPAGSMIMTILK